MGASASIEPAVGLLVSLSSSNRNVCRRFKTCFPPSSCFFTPFFFFLILIRTKATILACIQSVCITDLDFAYIKIIRLKTSYQLLLSYPMTWKTGQACFHFIYLLTILSYCGFGRCLSYLIFSISSLDSSIKHQKECLGRLIHTTALFF